MHITRTGGSTLRVALYRQFPPRAVLELDPPPGADPTPGWARYIETGRPPPNGEDLHGWMVRRLVSLRPRTRARLRVVAGHFFFGMDEHLDGPTTYITVLRDPVDRVLSQYHLRRRQGLSLGLEDYLRSGREWQVSDGQTRLLAGRWARHTDRIEDALEAAKGNLRDRFAVVGVTERFDETLALLRTFLGWRRAAATSHNVSEGRLGRENLSPSQLAELERLNEHDAELYRFAAELMDERLRSIEGTSQPAPPSRGAPLRWRVTKAVRRVGGPGRGMRG